MKDKEHISIICLNFPPEVGAAARRLQSVSATLAESGYQVRVITQLPNYPQARVYDGYEKKFISRETLGGVEVVRTRPLLFGKRTLLWRSVSELWFMAAAFLHSLCGPRPTFILATCPSIFSPFAALAASFFRQSRFLLEIRDLTWNYASAVKSGSSLLARVLEKAIVAAARRAALVICTNPAQQQYLVDRGIPSERCRVIPNGVDADLLEQLERTEETAGGFHAMYVGSVGYPQGLRVLVDAARLLADDNRFRITVLGDGPERDELAALAEAQGLTNIHFAGSVRPEEVGEQYAQADILVAHLRDDPAFCSALPSKLFEYMAVRRPVVFGGRGPGADLVRASEAGVVVEPGSAEAMAGAIRQIATDLDLARRLGENGGRYVRTHYRREAILQELVTALEQLHSPGAFVPVEGSPFPNP